MPLSNMDLVAFAKNALNSKAAYWYGTFWQRATASLHSQKKAQYPQHYTASRTAQYKRDVADGKMVCDCAGLIKGFFWSLNGTRTSKYADGFPDVSADQLISTCCELTGSISTMPDVPGVLVWLSGHIGVYIGNGSVIEARGFAYGVVQTQLKDRAWIKWGRLNAKYLTYGQATDPEPVELGDRPLRRGDVGDDVKQLQTLLIGWNYSVGKWGADGEFGAATQAAVLAWQYDQGLPETGIVDDDDYAAIDAALNPDDPGGGDDPSVRYVTVTGGNTVNIRSAPNTDATILGVANRGDSFVYADETAANGWYRIVFSGGDGWISNLYTALGDAPATTPDPPVDPPEKYVTVTSGNTVNIRSAPNTGSAILGVAYRGDSFEYAGQVATNGWFSIVYNADTGWISGQYTTLGDAPQPPDPEQPDDSKAVIVDLDQHSDLQSKKHDWAKLAKNVDLVILRCGVTRTETQPIGIGIDADFAYAAKQCAENGIPFGVYYYGKVNSAAKARKEADKAWETASPFDPLFYVYDVEEGRLTSACITAWADQIRQRGATKVGMYIGHNYYTKYKSTVSAFDFIWIPRYGLNDGKYYPKYAPAYPCDLHQYTSVGKVPGIADSTLDINRLTGTKPLSWFLAKS